MVTISFVPDGTNVGGSERGARYDQPWATQPLQLALFAAGDSAETLDAVFTQNQNADAQPARDGTGERPRRADQRSYPTD
jgi:hypothetical protein